MNTRSSVHEWIRSVVLLVMLLVLPQACAAQDRTVAERGADLEAAMWTGETEHAKEILDSGPIPETNSENLCWIQAAVTLNQSDLIEPLAEAGVDIDCEDAHMTALQYAVFYNRYQSAEALIHSGADVNAGIDEPDSTPPIIHAVQEYVARRVRGEDASDAEHLVRLLLQNGADPNVLEKPDAPSKLCIAAEQGQTEMVRLLIDSGALVNQVTDEGPNTPGVTALECALLRKDSNLETVQALLYAGADPTAGPHADKLLEKAEQNLPNAVPLLKQYGAK